MQVSYWKAVATLSEHLRLDSHDAEALLRPALSDRQLARLRERQLNTLPSLKEAHRILQRPADFSIADDAGRS